MRKLLLTLAALAVAGTAAMLAPSSASAAVVAPSAMQPAVADAVVVDNVAWVRRCHHHWRSSNHHCRRVWVPGFHYHHRHHHHRQHHHHHGHRGHRR
jgi:Ni/Co efflux regulator RcnB